MEKQELKALIKETTREVIQEERHNLCQILIPYVSESEQQELEAEFGIPLEESDEELVDLSDWVNNGGQHSRALKDTAPHMLKARFPRQGRSSDFANQQLNF